MKLENSLANIGHVKTETLLEITRFTKIYSVNSLDANMFADSANCSCVENMPSISGHAWRFAHVPKALKCLNANL